MKTVNYQKLADVLEWCIQYAKELQVNVEDPNGVRKNFSIKDISITLLNYHDRTIIFDDGIAGKSINIDKNTQVLIQIWIANTRKKVRMNFSYAGIIPDPDYLKIFFIKVIRANIMSAVNGFFLNKVKDNKFSLFSEEDAQIDLKEPAEIEEFTEDGVNQVENLFRWLYIQDNVNEVKGSLHIQKKVWVVCNSGGTKIIQDQNICSILLDYSYLSAKKNLINDIFSDHYKTFGNVLDAIPSIKEKLKKKLAKMEMKRIESGIYPILLNPVSVATLFHEAVAGHMLSAKYILNGNSTVFENKLGKKFANNGDMPNLDQISIYDDPLNENMLANYKYDMEGSLAKNICLLDKGIVRNYLTDRNTAARLKQKSNGHLLSASFVGENVDGTLGVVSPEPRISNLIIESHTNFSMDDIRKAVFEEFNWYLEIESRSGSVFVDTGTFDMEASCVTRVWKDGKREAIQSGTLSSNLTDFLASIQIVSNHYGEANGFCGSSSGYVPTHEKAPAMLIYGINFITDPKPLRFAEIDLSKDKFIPQSFLDQEWVCFFIRRDFIPLFFY